MKILTLEDWESAKLLFSDDRLRIIDLVRDEPLSIARLSDLMSRNPGSIHNHINKLIDAGIVVRSESTESGKRGAPEKRYQLAADDVLIGDLGEDNGKVVDAISKRAAKDALTILSTENGRARRFEGYLTDNELEQMIALLDKMTQKFASTPADGKKRTRFFYMIGDVE